ncbi:uncharacterized protein LOC135416980 isoform X2 [Pseudopipra pipra]|uniref:uncharacterized protein LOC135416979 isoform X2 n=1 Tax=Pseudopipra pipra TaxID=415032 RepID=UPI003138AE3D
MVCEFTRCIWREETIAMGTGGMANSDLHNAETSAALLDLLVENGVSNPKKVPAFVRYIHRWLTSSVSPEHSLDKTLLDLAEAHPVDVVVTLLRSAPSCDRAAATMWRTIIFSSRTAQSVLEILALVLGSWPACSMCTPDGDETDVFALALSFWNWTLLTPTSPPGQLFIFPQHCISLPQALGWKPGLGAGSGAPGQVLFLCLPWPLPPALGPCHMDVSALSAVSSCFTFLQTNVALWTALQLPWCPRTVRECFPSLFVHLLFQVFFNAVHRLEEDDAFWRECQDQHSLPTNANRFAVLTIQALLCHLRCEGVVMALERKCGWDTLLNADTHHCAVGLLASTVCCLLELLSEEMCPWELPAMAFLVEVLVDLDVTECGESILQILSRHLWSECPEMRCQVLRGLMVLSQDPVMARRMGSLTESLEELLWDADRELVRMTATVFEFLSSEKDI